MEHRTSVVIAHHLATIRHADVIFVIQDAKLVEQGSRDALLARRGAFAAMYNIQTGKTA